MNVELDFGEIHLMHIVKRIINNIEPVSLHNYPPQMPCQCLLNVGRVTLQEYSVKTPSKS